MPPIVTRCIHVLVVVAARCDAIVLACCGSVCCGAHGHAASPPPPPALSPLEQAFSQIISDDEAVREAALRVVIEQGDSTVIPRLEDIRATADRPIRLAIKPVMDLLKNRAKLESPEADARRSAATDLGTSGKACGHSLAGTGGGQRDE